MLPTLVFITDVEHAVLLKLLFVHLDNLMIYNVENVSQIHILTVMKEVFFENVSLSFSTSCSFLRFCSVSTCSHGYIWTGHDF